MEVGGRHLKGRGRKPTHFKFLGETAAHDRRKKSTELVKELWAR